MFVQRKSTARHNNQRRLSDSEKEFICANCRSMTITELARSIKRCFTTVQSYMQSAGLYAQRRTAKRANSTSVTQLPIVDRAYLAGIIDGEGTVTVARRYNGSRNKTYYQPSLVIANTSTRLRDWLVVRGFSSGLYTASSGNPCWKMSAGGLALGSVLCALLPYLVIKEPQAQLVVEFCQLRGDQKIRDKPTPRMLQIYGELRRLNMRVARPAEYRSPPVQSSTT